MYFNSNTGVYRFHLTLLRTDGDFCLQGQDTKIPPKRKLRLSEHTDMTIHWNALEEHFLLVPIVFFESTSFLGGNAFSEFFSKNLSPKEIKGYEKYSIK
jgi:hypothetical protein